MAEKLELVTDFGKLRAGMLVVGKPCSLCGSAHRGILLDLVPAHNPRLHGPMVWTCLPNAHEDWGRAVVAKRDVSEGRVYRVVDGLKQTSESHAERPKKLEATR